jgi:hypothetical protein
VDNLKERGVDFIKVYSGLPHEAYLAIAEEANKLNIPFADHVPESVTAAEASDAGQKSMEHLYQIALACSRIEAKLGAEHLHSFREIAERRVSEAETYDQERSGEGENPVREIRKERYVADSDTNSSAHQRLLE